MRACRALLVTTLLLSCASGADVMQIKREIHQAGVRYGIHPKLIDSVARAESSYNPLAASPKGAMGIMQLMSPTARRLGVSDPWNVRQNVEGGARLLRTLIGRYDGNLPCALAAYNAGEAAVSRRGCAPYPETELYVKRVLGSYFGRTIELPAMKQKSTAKRRLREKKAAEGSIRFDRAGRVEFHSRPAFTGGQLMR